MKVSAINKIRWSCGRGGLIAITILVTLVHPGHLMSEPMSEPEDFAESWTHSDLLDIDPKAQLSAELFEPMSESQTDPQKPNILLILVDDLGWQDTSVPFHTVETPYNQSFRTPHMDRLASSGVRFSQAYSASPVCTPTRVSIMTGRHPARSNVTNWTLHNSVETQESAYESYPLRSPNWAVEGLQPGELTLPALLQKQGYRTIHIGKAHFGALETPGADPLNLGFDINIGGHAGGSPGSYFGEHHYQRTPGEESVMDVPHLEKYHGSDTHLTEALTLEAMSEIARSVADGQPFFMNLAHYAVHTPIMADTAFIDHYEGYDPVEAAYHSMVEGMDHSLGMLLDELERLGIADRTLLIFTSDNGALSAHTRGQSVLGTGLNTHNLPLRSGKGSVYEGGVRIPLILSWAEPAGSDLQNRNMDIEPGSLDETPVISMDLFPTIAAVAGVDLPEGYVHDGVEIVPLVRSGWGLREGEQSGADSVERGRREGSAARVSPEYGTDKGNSSRDSAGGSSRKGSEEMSSRSLFWHYPHKWSPPGPGLDPFTAVRRGDWKLIYFYKTASWELYNLSDDLSETRNLLWRTEDVGRELAREMTTWMREVEAQLPVDGATGAPVPFPSFEIE